MTTVYRPKGLAALIKHLRGAYPQVPQAQPEPSPIDAGEPLLGQFVRAFLIWESTCAKATLALKRIEQSVVDFNELRVCMPGELVRVLGERYPRADERARRMRSALNAIYSREHKVTLQRLTDMPKRESRDYLESLDGTPRFVAARVSLLGLAGHMAPVDGRMVRLLAERGILEVDATPEAAAAVLERKVRAPEMPEFYALLQAWSDDGGGESCEALRVPDAAATKAEGRRTGAPQAGGPKFPEPKAHHKSPDAKK